MNRMLHGAKGLARIGVMSLRNNSEAANFNAKLHRLAPGRAASSAAGAALPTVGLL